jgi:hypothetical protein
LAGRIQAPTRREGREREMTVESDLAWDANERLKLENDDLRRQLGEASVLIEAYEKTGQACPQCGSGFVSWNIETEHFQYGAGDDAPWLECEIPVNYCDNACNGTHGEPRFSWLDWRAENIKHRTVVEALLRARIEQMADDIGAFADRNADLQSRYDRLREAAKYALPVLEELDKLASSGSPKWWLGVATRKALCELRTALADGEKEKQ